MWLRSSHLRWSSSARNAVYRDRLSGGFRYVAARLLNPRVGVLRDYSTHGWVCCATTQPTGGLRDSPICGWGCCTHRNRRRECFAHRNRGSRTEPWLAPRDDPAARAVPAGRVPAAGRCIETARRAKRPGISIRRCATTQPTGGGAAGLLNPRVGVLRCGIESNAWRENSRMSDRCFT